MNNLTQSVCSCRLQMHTNTHISWGDFSYWCDSVCKVNSDVGRGAERIHSLFISLDLSVSLTSSVAMPSSTSDFRVWWLHTRNTSLLKGVTILLKKKNPQKKRLNALMLLDERECVCLAFCPQRICFQKALQGLTCQGFTDIWLNHSIELSSLSLISGYLLICTQPQFIQCEKTTTIRTNAYNTNKVNMILMYWSSWCWAAVWGLCS